MSTLTKEEALQIIAKIREDNGGITPADRELTPKSVLRTVEKLRGKLGSATSTLAQKIYSKDTRFVFELVQNAEDNSYSRALAEKDDPYITFNLFSDRIIVDSNEDGFTTENVYAICDIDKSTKINSPGYIGEKGIGFKSVFRIASKVHIQSGSLSFSFEHLKGDSGMGMVTPMDEDYENIPLGVRTRMTLTLINGSDFSISELDRRKTGKTDFAELPDNFMLFLSRLKQIKIIINLPNGLSSQKTYTYRYDGTTHTGELTKDMSSSDDSASGLTTTCYKITKRQLENLPAHTARPHRNHAEVVLAFPVDKESRPIIDEQYVSAFLPLRKVGFSFLIQSDFITQASREDIMWSPWNQAILDGVAEAFRDAVLQFCRYPILDYQWVLFLPTGTISDSFWAQLPPKIFELLKNAPVLQSWSGKQYKSPNQVKYLGSSCRDQYNEPLFEDLVNELYLSRYYDRYYRIYLKRMGVETVSVDDILDRIDADLEKTVPKIVAPTTDDDWHTRVATMLCGLLEDSRYSTVQEEIRAMRLIPLENRVLVSSKEHDTFYPDYNGVSIPTDLGICLVNPEAIQNKARKKLFSLLGVTHCESKHIRKKILEKYNKWNAASLDASISHLRYLFWNPPEEEQQLDGRIYLKDQNEIPVYRMHVTFGRGDLVVDDLYFESQEEYGTQKLLERIERSVKGSISVAPGLPVHFLNTSYLEAVSPKASHGGQSWVSWLEKVAGVRRSPRLLKRSSPKELSDVFLYILENRKDKLLGVLKTHWSEYVWLITPAIAEILAGAEVECENGEVSLLKESYLPVPKLRKISKQMGVDQRFPFLKLPVELTRENEKEWYFLKKFGAGTKESVDFYLEVLKSLITDSFENLNGETRPEYFRVYEAIQEYNKPEDHEKIRQFFLDEYAIFVPPEGSENGIWATPEHCVWNAPAFLGCKLSLASKIGYSGNSKLSYLSCFILRINDANWRTYLEELTEMAQNTDHVSVENVLTIYHYISQNVSHGEDWKQTREQFEKSKVIYVKAQGKWYQTSSCLWSDTTQITGKVSIRNEYADLEDFFVAKLGVETPNITLFIQELKMLIYGVWTPDIEEIKACILGINALGPRKGDLDPLLLTKFLPVNDGNGCVSLMRVEDDFAITDRREFGNAFRGKLVVLDFSLEDVHVLRPFLSLLGLEGRYMSITVREVSSVKGGLKQPDLSSEFRNKAYALFRCCVHYHSPKAEGKEMSLYRLLVQTDIYESDGFSKTLILGQNGRLIKVESDKGNLHIEEDSTQLRIYVPNDKKDQDRCYLSQLPIRLMEFIDIKTMEARALIVSILTAKQHALEYLLEFYGIVQVPGVEPLSDTLPPEVITNSVQLDNSKSPRTVRGESRRSSIELDANPNRERPTSNAPRSPLSPFTFSGIRDTPPRIFVGSASSRPQETPQRVFVGHDEYRTLLDRLVNAANQAAFPAQGLFDFTEMSNALPTSSEYTLEHETLSNSIFGVRSKDQLSHDMKIGAAGELYVFEILLHLGVPNFGRPNWKSTIRKEVQVHPKYSDLEPWDGAETADIVYDDIRGGFTEILIENGYLPSGPWQYAHPKYYLEVKTTTKGCNTPFYMSKSQYKRMQRMTLATEQSAAEVYVILRVFNLGQKDMGLRVYLDPESLRLDKKLDFTAESYTIVPSKPSGV